MDKHIGGNHKRLKSSTLYPFSGMLGIPGADGSLRVGNGVVDPLTLLSIDYKKAVFTFLCDTMLNDLEQIILICLFLTHVKWDRRHQVDSLTLQWTHHRVEQLGVLKREAEWWDA